MTFQVNCCIFEGISANANGAILNVYQGTVLFSNNIITSVSSKTYPGCIYVTGCEEFNISKSSFSRCFGISKNDQYSNVFSCTSTKSSNGIDISAFLCSPISNLYSDSVFYFDSVFNIESVNTSYCYGTYGSSSVAYWNVNGNSNIKFLNNAHSKEYCCLESIYSGSSHCQSSNFINGSTNSGYVVNIQSDVYFYKCIFSGNGDKAFTPNNFIDKCHFADCYSSDTLHSFSDLIKTDSIDFIPITILTPKTCLYFQNTYIHYCICHLQMIKIMTLIMINKILI